MEVKSNGGVYGCCEGWMPKPLGNILDTPLAEIWYGATALEVRASILDGSFRFCTACPYLPGPGGPVATKTPSDLGDASHIKTLKMDYDQSCNLTCPSCRTSHSNQFVNLDIVRRIHEAVMASGFVELTDQLYITGSGDPFASPIFWPLLQNFPKMKTPPKIFLHTNGQLFDAVHWDLMSSSSHLVSDVGVSVDAATEATYIENRRAPWNKLWNNIEFMNSIQTNQPFTLGMFFTVQANNFKEVIPFVRLAFNHNAAWISLTALRNWGTYSDDEYAARAVHVPGHPLHDQFKEVMNDGRLKDKRIVVDSFKPEHNVQTPLVQAQSLLRRKG